MAYIWYLALICYLSLVESSKHSIPAKDFYGRDVILHYEPIDCFKDKSNPRALRNLYYDARAHVLTWHRWPAISQDIIKVCAVNAFKKGYTSIFGIQFYGECWSDGSAEARFAMYGKSSQCVEGLGQSWTNFVYRLTVSHKAPTKCHINGKDYEQNEIMNIPNDWSDNVGNAKCMKCKCVDGQAQDCIASYYCETGFGGLCSKYKNSSRSCCPVCDCYNNGQVMPKNSTWTVRNARKECSLCICGEDGIATCTERTTCPLCFGDQIPNPGQCCPQCVKRTTTTAAPKTIILPAETTRPPPVIPPRPLF